MRRLHRWLEVRPSWNYFRLWAEQNHCAIHEFFIREIADQILEFLGSIISFHLPVEFRADWQGVKIYSWQAVFTVYYLLYLPARRQRYHLSWLSLTTWHQSLIISYQPGPQQILLNLALFQPMELPVYSWNHVRQERLEIYFCFNCLLLVLVFVLH